MNYKISCYLDKNFKFPVFTYSSSIIPRKDEIIYSSHKGEYLVKDIIYIISDDDEKFNNEVLFINIYCRKKNGE